MLQNKKIKALIIIGAVIVGLIGFRIADWLYPSDKTPVEEKVIQNEYTENSILLLSDGSIDEDQTSIKSETMRYLAENDGYKYAEKIVDNGLLGSQLMYKMLEFDESFGKYQYVIINGGMRDFGVQESIGDIDSSGVGFCNAVYTFFDEASKKTPNTKYFLVGLPYVKDLKISDEEEINISIADYNFALKTIADMYDNVYFLDFSENTKLEPIEFKYSDYFYDIDSLQKIYNSFKNAIK